MNKNLVLYSDTTKEYIRQINQLLDIAEKSDRKQIFRLTDILNKLKSSLQKLQKEQPRLKQYINNSAKYRAIMQPYIDLLAETKAEIEKVQL